MRASQRYARISEFAIVDVRIVYYRGTSENHAITLKHETADMKDTVGGYEYQQGMHKVTAIHSLSGKSFKRAKTFYGESAWNDASRLHDDHYFELARG